LAFLGVSLFLAKGDAFLSRQIPVTDTKDRFGREVSKVGCESAFLRVVLDK